MNQSPPGLDVIAVFRRQLAELPEPRPRTPGAAVVAATAVLAAVPLVVILAGTGASSDALAITRDSTSLELRIADASADPQQLTRELNEVGIRGRVLVVPVAPGDAGTWIVAAEIAGRRTTCIPVPGTSSTQETVRLGKIENAGAVLRIPAARVRESSGSFVLVAGRDAQLGERTVDPGSPEAVHRLLDPLLGPPPASLPSC